MRDVLLSVGGRPFKERVQIHSGANVAGGLGGGGSVFSTAQAWPAQGELELCPIALHWSSPPRATEQGLMRGQSLLALTGRRLACPGEIGLCGCPATPPEWPATQSEPREPCGTPQPSQLGPQLRRRVAQSSKRD